MLFVYLRIENYFYFVSNPISDIQNNNNCIIINVVVIHEISEKNMFYL